MKLSKRNGIYRLDYYDPLGNRQRKSLGTRDRAEAEQLAHRLLTGHDPRSDVWTLAKALEETYATVWSRQKSWKTRESLVKVVTVDLGHYLLGEVTYQLLAEYVAKCYKQDFAPATINRRLATVSKALNEAAKRGKLAGVPPIPLQPENNKRTRWLEEEEEVRLLARCDVLRGREMHQLTDLLVFLVDTGARLGEALSLRPANVDDNSVLFLDTKSTVDKPKHRRVPLTMRAKGAAVRVARANQLGVQLTKSQLEKRLTRVRNAAGLSDVTFHTLRHTCASRLIQRGAKLHEVREWLGHSSVTVTERYAHLADSSLSHLTASLENVGTLPGTLRPGVTSVGHSAKNVAHFPTRPRTES